MDLRLAGVYLACIAVITHCYPAAQLTWDGYYYIEISQNFRSSIRPGGYPYFLKLLNSITWSLPLIVTCQYILHFLSIWFFLHVVDKVFRIKEWQYFLLGLILITEPVALYHCFAILSDVLFSALTLAYMSTLILFIRKRSAWLFVVHVLFIFACIEVRHIALFYPYFSFVIIALYYRKLKPVLIYGAVIFSINFSIMQLHIRANLELYQVPVYSAFSGWTHTNNTLYALPYMPSDTSEIKDPEVRRMHGFFKTYMDTSSFKMPFIGSGFLWDDKSPMCVIRKKLQDSLHAEFIQAWHILSPSFTKYGIYMQTHYPMAYIKGYMIPNMETLFHPHDGEMMDYYVTRDMNVTMLEWYHKKPEDFYARHQIYKNTINAWNLTYYHIRLTLFTLAMIASLFFFRRIRKQTDYFFVPVILFIGAFYMLTLYSSWFMYRYLIPVIPMQVAVIFTMLIVVFRKKAATETPAEIPSQSGAIENS